MFETVLSSRFLPPAMGRREGAGTKVSRFGRPLFSAPAPSPRPRGKYACAGTPRTRRMNASDLTRASDEVFPRRPYTRAIGRLARGMRSTLPIPARVPEARPFETVWPSMISIVVSSPSRLAPRGDLEQRFTQAPVGRHEGRDWCRGDVDGGGSDACLQGRCADDHGDVAVATGLSQCRVEAGIVKGNEQCGRRRSNVRQSIVHTRRLRPRPWLPRRVRRSMAATP